MSVNIYNSNPNASSEAENFQTVANRGSKLASDTIYSNTTSGLNSVNVQGAIDEVNGKVEDNVEAISRINSDLNPTYFHLIPGGSVTTIESQDNWRQGNRIHIAFSATSNMVMHKDDIWAIVPSEHKGRGTRICGYVHIDGNPDIYINSVMIDGSESGHIYQTWASSVPANTRVTFIADYFI